MTIPKKAEVPVRIAGHQNYVVEIEWGLLHQTNLALCAYWGW